MTAATVTERLETNDPTVEVVIVTASNTNTYVSKKFGAVKGVQATIMEDGGTITYPMMCAVSGATITLHCDELSSNKVCLTIYGRK